MRFHDLTWPLLREVSRDATLVLAPIAACEQHSRYLPTFTDTILVTAVAEGVEQRFRSGHRTRQTIADANGHRRRSGLAVMHHVEMRIECSDLVDLGLGHVQLLGECCEVAH